MSGDPPRDGRFHDDPPIPHFPPLSSLLGALIPYADPIVRKRYLQAYYQKHRAELDARNRAWPHNHPERARELRLQRRLNNPQAYREHYTKQNSSELGKQRKARWFANHPNAVKDYRAEVRARLFQMYGHVCAKCGFSDKRALQLDHVNNDGAQQRPMKNGKRLSRCESEWRKALSEYRPDKYQILCANCNWIKRDEIYRPQTKAAAV